MTNDIFLSAGAPSRFQNRHTCLQCLHFGNQLLQCLDRDGSNAMVIQTLHCLLIIWIVGVGCFAYKACETWDILDVVRDEANLFVTLGPRLVIKGHHLRVPTWLQLLHQLDSVRDGCFIKLQSVVGGEEVTKETGLDQTTLVGRVATPPIRDPIELHEEYASVCGVVCHTRQ